MDDHDNAVMSPADRLIYMANQIARNVASMGREQAEATVEDHIRSFWDPTMRRQIVALAAERPDALSSIAAAAVSRIAAP